MSGLEWFNEFVKDLFLYNSIFIGLATLSAFLTKRYGVFSILTITTMISLNTSFLLYMTFNPYYNTEIFNLFFYLAPVIMVRVYYDKRLSYIFIIVNLFAIHLNYFLGEIKTMNLSFGIIYLLLAIIIMSISPLKNKTVHTILLFSITYVSIILSMFFLGYPIERMWIEIILLGLNIFTMTYIGALIMPGLIQYVEMTYTKRDLEIDGLTGVYNRLSFNHHMDWLFLKETNQNIEDFSLLFFDINKFKQINDTYGHPIGDVVLKAFACKLKQELLEDEKVFRYGGDEFIVVTPKIGSELLKLVKQLENKVQNHAIPIDDDAITISYSLGISEYHKDTHSVLEMVKIADKNMYINKKQTSSAI